MDILRCILKIYPDYKCVVWENDYNRIIRHELEKRNIPSLAELQAVWPQVQQDIANEQAARQQKIADISTNLPSWDQVQTAVNNIANLADAKAFLLKLSRVVYWLAKDSLT